MPLQLSDRADLLSPLPLYTVVEARMLGLRLNTREWTRLRKGVYVARAAFDVLPSWKRYAVRVHAFLRTHPDAVLCLESAGVIHGLPHFGETKDIHVYDPDTPTSWRQGDVAIHTSRDTREVELVGGVRVTSLRDTVVDLARVLPPAQGLTVADAAVSPVQGGMLRIDELSERGAEQQNQRGRARMRWTWENADGRSESPAESVSRAVIMWSGFEQPDLQREFRYEGHRDRADFHFPSSGAVGESDGWGKYDLDDPEAARRHLQAEKRREDRLRRNGHPVIRWELRDAWNIDPLCEALRKAGVPLSRPAQSAMLASLRAPSPRTMPFRRQKGGPA